MNTNQLSRQISDLAHTLAQLDATPKAELTASFAGMYVPSLPHARTIAGGAPLDSQLEANASDAERTMYECDEAEALYDRLTEQAAAILRSPVLKSVKAMSEAGKKQAQARRDECEKVAADARAELAKRQQAREDAMAELEAAQEAADKVEAIRQQLADLRATFR